MIVKQDQARIASIIIWWQVRRHPHHFHFVPPDTRFILSACERARHFCLEGADFCYAAGRALRETERNEIELVATIIAPFAARYARRFQLQADDVTSATLVRVLSSVRDNFEPPPGSDGNDFPTQSLRKYLRPAVYWTARKLRYGRERGRSNLQDVLLAHAEAHVEAELNMLSESSAHQAYEDVMRKLARPLARKPKYALRLRAIMYSDSLAEAAQIAGMSPDAMRQWLAWLRKRYFR
jgi:hypothetical protein